MHAKPEDLAIPRPWYLPLAGGAYPAGAVLTVAVVLTLRRRQEDDESTELISRARAKSLLVRPPSECVVHRKVRDRQRMSMSG
jgi:hypothetical protein